MMNGIYLNREHLKAQHHRLAIVREAVQSGDIVKALDHLLILEKNVCLNMEQIDQQQTAMRQSA